MLERAPLNAVLGVRVSTDKQASIGDSPEDQIEQGKRYAQLNNIVIKETLTYAESSSKASYQPMQHVVDYAIDQVYRPLHTSRIGRLS